MSDNRDAVAQLQLTGPTISVSVPQLQPQVVPGSPLPIHTTSYVVRRWRMGGTTDGTTQLLVLIQTDKSLSVAMFYVHALYSMWQPQPLDSALPKPLHFRIDAVKIGKPHLHYLQDLKLP
jgi:hypothetical protein